MFMLLLGIKDFIMGKVYLEMFSLPKYQNVYLYSSCTLQFTVKQFIIF